MLHTSETLPKTSVENVLTIDIEDWFHILDIASTPSLPEWSKLESKVIKNTQVILDLLSKHNTKGTFFCSGVGCQPVSRFSPRDRKARS